MPDRPPALHGERVREFVIAGHGNFERVKEMLAEEPSLINAAWDWGGRWCCARWQVFASMGPDACTSKSLRRISRP